MSDVIRKNINKKISKQIKYLQDNLNSFNDIKALYKVIRKQLPEVGLYKEGHSNPALVLEYKNISKCTDILVEFVDNFHIYWTPYVVIPGIDYAIKFRGQMTEENNSEFEMEDGSGLLSIQEAWPDEEISYWPIVTKEDGNNYISDISRKLIKDGINQEIINQSIKKTFEIVIDKKLNIIPIGKITNKVFKKYTLLL